MYIVKLKYLDRHTLADFIYNCARLLADADPEDSFGMNIPLTYRPEICETPDAEQTGKGVKN